RRPRRRWLKFAGNWNPQGPYPWSYRLQRFWLRKGWARGWVTVNGRWPGQPPWVRPFDNPSLDADEEATAAEAAGAKATPPPLHLLFVGALVTTKGVATALRAAAYARQGGLDLTFDIVGDGPERASFESLARDLGLSDVVRFHGWVPRDDVGPFYAAAHLFLLPSHSEGWPKVVSEAMAHGAVPLVSSVSCIPQVLGECGAGETYDFDDAEAFGRGILAYAADAERWRRESRAGVRAARRFTYTHYLDRVRALLSDSPHP
ncbi:MAG: glycosyltransferase, partial [Acidobacteriota bacterium]